MTLDYIAQFQGLRRLNGHTLYYLITPGEKGRGLDLTTILI
jgi:hypothetical protein